MVFSSLKFCTSEASLTLVIQKVKVHNYHHTLTHMHLLFTVVVGDVVVGGIVSGGGVVSGGVVGGGVRMMFGEQVELLG